MHSLFLCIILVFTTTATSSRHLRHIHHRRNIVAPSFTIEPLGQATSYIFPSIHRDGGGGGVLSNQNWIVFSDTKTENSFASNTYATSDPNNPTNLTDFPFDDAPKLAVPWEANESPSSDYIWPSTSITTRDAADTTGYAVYPVGTRCDADGCEKYNTLVQITANGSSGLQMQRLIPQFFNADEPQFGTFSTTYDVSSDCLYLFSSDGRIARVKFDSAGDKSQYTYWSAMTYSTSYQTATQITDITGSPVTTSCSFSTGDVFYSTVYQNWLIVYMTTCGDSTFYIRYSVSGQIEGPYSAAQTLYKTIPPADDPTHMNYAGHAYPQFLGNRNGSEVLLSWTEQPAGGYQMGMAKVMFQI